MARYDFSAQQWVIGPGDLAYWRLPFEVRGRKVIPCRVVAVDSFWGVTIRLTTRHGDFHAGEEIAGVSAGDVLPRDCVVFRDDAPPLILKGRHRVEREEFPQVS